jgi:uncharacterized protein YceK
MRKILTLALPALLLSGCATVPKSTAPAPAKQQKVDRPALKAPAPLTARGLEAVMGKDAAALKRMFGEPRLDVIEVNGRKLQFVGTACVLDAYLYKSANKGPELVTYIDARRSDGAEVDRASCVNALQRR